jgi:anaerobic ribonucleoside-triphosphate reductase activating protein
VRGSRMLNIQGVLPRTSVNGPGERTLVHLQGCSIHCDGCFNKWSWSKQARTLVEPEKLAADVLVFGDNVSISGGEPMDQPADLAMFVRALRLRRPSCSILLFTGYTLEQLNKMVWWDVVAGCLDILVAGPYQRDRHAAGAVLVSSTNQELVLMSTRHTMQEVLGEAPTVEAHVSPDGVVTMTGFPPEATLRALRTQEVTP